MFRRRSIQSMLVSVVTMAVFLVGTLSAEAARKDPGLGGNHLTIEEVQVDLGAGASGQLTIRGEHFSFSNTLAVRLGVSDEILTVVGVPTDTEIAVDLPADLPAGEYLLTVSTGNGPTQNDEFDLTIGGSVVGEFPCNDGGTPVGDRWVISESGLTVCDNLTNRTWEQHPAAGPGTRDESIAFCQNKGTAWELPIFQVLQTLQDKNSNLCGAGGPCLPDDHPFSNVRSGDYWSATPLLGDPGQSYFTDFGPNPFSDTDANFFLKNAWCVRTAPTP